MIDLNLFKDSELWVPYQFTFMMIIEFIYHTIFYYGVAAKDIDKPDFNYVLLFIIFHMLQIYLIKYFHVNKKFLYSWAVIMIPSLLYLAYSKYKEKQSTKDQLEYWKYLAATQQQNQQGPPAPPPGQFPNHNLMRPMANMNAPALAPPPPVQGPSYGSNQMNNPQLEQYGYGNQLAEMNNTGSFSNFSANEFDPFSSPYTSL